MDSAIVGGLLFLRRLFAAPALAQYVICETTPGPGVATDDEPLNFARQNGSRDRKPTAQTDPLRTFDPTHESNSRLGQSWVDARHSGRLGMRRRIP